MAAPNVLADEDLLEQAARGFSKFTGHVMRGCVGDEVTEPIHRNDVANANLRMYDPRLGRVALAASASLPRRQDV